RPFFIAEPFAAPKARPRTYQVARRREPRVRNSLASGGIGRASARKGGDEQIISPLSCNKVAPEGRSALLLDRSAGSTEGKQGGFKLRLGVKNGGAKGESIWRSGSSAFLSFIEESAGLLGN